MLVLENPKNRGRAKPMGNLIKVVEIQVLKRGLAGALNSQKGKGELKGTIKGGKKKKDKQTTQFREIAS